MTRTCRTLLFASACLTLAACSERGGPAGVGSASQALISDQLHNKGTRGFLFLPPMVPAPGDYGATVAGLPVTVRVDELNVDGSVRRSLATFTSVTGPRGEHMRENKVEGHRYLDDDDGDDDSHAYYLARWETDDANLSESASYRVRVFVPARGGGTRELGFSDVSVVRNERQFKGVDTSAYTPLVNGSTLRIKFRIDTPAVDADGDGVWDWNDNCPSVANKDQKDSLKNGTGDACRCVGVTCKALDACHVAGVCGPTTGVCTNPLAADNTACALSGATAACKTGACVISSCNAGRGDCDGKAANGCETDLGTTSNCGACGTACAGGANAIALCQSGSCALGCNAGYGNCDGLAGNGCELPLTSDAANCGTCGLSCDEHEGCVSGACTAAVCQGGFADCDGAAGNGCEATLATDLANCGGCGSACSPANATGACVAGGCSISTCKSGYADCDKTVGNGCEISTATDVGNCGACGRVCNVANAASTCVAGSCAIGGCDTGFADCDKSAVDGCEVDTTADVGNCGGCGVACKLDYATASCAASACAVAACADGFADCDGLAANGCEVSINGARASLVQANYPGSNPSVVLADVNNCGGCGVTCAPRAHSAPTCAAGACGLACDAGWADCDGDISNGCEIDLTSDAGHCGACTTACGNHETCQSGACSATVCAAGWANCDHDAGNGCESLSASDVQNCGRCGNACSFANATAECTAGACGFSVCVAGFADCDGAAANGCEIDLSSDGANCGACGSACTGGQACASGSCACPAGKTFCGGACVDTSSDGANCGACGTACGAASSCIGGACVCGEQVCGNQCVDLTSDVNNCGSCGVACGGPNAVGACSAGQCALVCNLGYADCDPNAPGCETQGSCQVCGNGQVEGAEGCDDGNLIAGDGCSATCAVEPGWTCLGTPSKCKLCGDHLLEVDETCDDGNTVNGDGCSSTCQIEPGGVCDSTATTCSICGNGKTNLPESCDDGNRNTGDGCSASCQIEPGWSCTFHSGGLSCCSRCGNGVVECGEQCDDGNNTSGDGCSSLCKVERTWKCSGTQPSICTH